VPFSALVANHLWLAANAAGERQFRTALADPEGTQRNLLRDLLRRNAGTEFGRAHGFPAIRSAEEYQARVPLSTWEDVAPWVSRIEAGEERVLTREPVRALELSSGSSAAAKRVPYTAELQREFRRAVAPWIADLYKRRPELLEGSAYWSITPPALEEARARPSAVRVGFEEDSEYLGGFWKHLANATLAVPGVVRKARDIEELRYATLLFLLRRADLALISVWHPSFLTLLLGALPEAWDSLLRDVERGSVLLGRSLPPLPERAAELRRVGPEAPARLWPRMRLISCWGDAHAALHVPEVQRLFPHAEIQPKGLIATEAFVTLPYGGRHPLAIRSHFFEFLPEGGDGRPRLAHELEAGDIASVIVTTGGGLYRYQLQDRVAVDGFVSGTPSLRFLGKEGHVSDLRGEKLHESFVAGALARVFGALRISPRFAMLAPGDGGEPPGYTLYVEAAEPVLPGELAPALETELAANPHYRLCVALGQLAPATTFFIRGDGVSLYLERCRGRGQRLGAVKPLALSPDSGWSRVFQRRIDNIRSDGPT
jgi:hypothetical protein